MKIRDCPPSGVIGPDESLNEDLIRTLNEALYFAGAACQFDNANEIQLSCEQYDKTVLYIDEVLGKLSEDTVQHSKLLLLRNSYNDRLEFLKHYNGSKGDLAQVNEAKNLSNSLKKRISYVAFKEDKRLLDGLAINDCAPSRQCEKRPESLLKLPYWQMRFVLESISMGSFLTPSIFIPSTVWSQSGVKFCGLSMKTSAFQTIIAIIKDVKFIDKDRTNIFKSLSTLSALFSDLKNANDLMIILQNQLSKPFPYIKEVPLDESSKSNAIKGQVLNDSKIL